jgi:cell division protein FtsB
MTIQVTKATGIEKLVLVLAIILFLFVGAAGYYFGTGHSNTQLQKQITDLLTKITELTGRIAKDDAIIASNDVTIAQGVKDKEALQAKNTVLEAKNIGLMTENTEYKKQIKQMTDIQLANEIGSRIGPNEVQMFISGQWRFSLTRTGGEKTVSIFKDAETYFTLASNRKTELDNANLALKSMDVALTASQDSTKLALGARDEAVGLLGESKVTIGDLNKDNLRLSRKLKLSKFTNTGIGVGVGVVAVILFNSFKK